MIVKKLIALFLTWLTVSSVMIAVLVFAYLVLLAGQSLGPPKPELRLMPDWFNLAWTVALVAGELLLLGACFMQLPAILRGRQNKIPTGGK